MPLGARSSASPFARPTSPAFEALYAARPSRGRSPMTEPVKISRPPSCMTRAAARAPRNAPVRLTSTTFRQVDGFVSRGPATTGEMPALQIQTSSPPHSVTVASATDSLKSSSVTSPLSTSEGPGSASATAFRSFSVRATRATRAPAWEKAWARSVPRPRLEPVITTRLPATSPGPGNDSGIAIGSAIGLYRPVQYTGRGSQPVRPRGDAPADARDPRVRAAGRRALPRRRGARLRAPVDRAGGGRRRRVLATRYGRRDHVHAPGARALPGQGPRPAR